MRLKFPNVKLKYILCFILLVFFFIFFIRFFSERQLDDVNPGRLCEDNFLSKSDVLMIIPILENVSIAKNKDWCESILLLNKTLAMHGVYHTPNEFEVSRDEEYITLGMEEFKDCFGSYPYIFEAPQLALDEENNWLLKKMGFEVRGLRFNIFHKVYHCIDYEESSYLKKLNSFINLF